MCVVHWGESGKCGGGEWGGGAHEVLSAGCACVGPGKCGVLV